MEFTIIHQTTYRYPASVHESYTICHLQPRSDTHQFCTKYDLSISPRARIFSYTDRYANDVQHFAVIPDHDVLSIVARSNVVTTLPRDAESPVLSTRDLLRDDPEVEGMYDFLEESQYIVFSPQLRTLAAEVGVAADDLCDWYRHAGHFIKSHFTYDKKATSVRSPIQETIDGRSGVCQDFAHILIALCRYNGIPARYASGYIFSGQEGSVLGAEASHAWCEAYLPPNGWVGLDPTNDKLINDYFVKVAIGRDYADVSPVRGVYKGSTHGTMSVNVGVELLGGSVAAQQQQQ